MTSMKQPDSESAWSDELVVSSEEVERWAANRAKRAVSARDNAVSPGDDTFPQYNNISVSSSRQGTIYNLWKKVWPKDTSFLRLNLPLAVVLKIIQSSERGWALYTCIWQEAVLRNKLQVWLPLRDDLAKWGISKDVLGPTLRKLEEIGVIAILRRDRAGTLVKILIPSVRDDWKRVSPDPDQPDSRQEVYLAPATGPWSRGGEWLAAAND